MTKPARDRWLARLTGHCARHPRWLAGALAGSALATVAAVAIPLIERGALDNAVLAHREPVWRAAVLLIAAAGLTYLGIFTRRFTAGRLALNVQHDLRTQILASLTALDGARQDQLSTGQVVSRSISDLNMVYGLLTMLPWLLGNALLFVLALVIMAMLSPVLTVVALAVAPALWLIAIASRRTLFPASWDAQQRSAEVAGVVDGAVTGVRVVKGFGQEDQENDRLERASRSLYSARMRAVALVARYNPALQAVPMIGQVGILLLGGTLALRGAITIGTFLAFSAYLAQLVGPVRALAGLLTIGQEAKAAVQRVFEVIDTKPALRERAGAAVLPDEIPGIELDDVWFGYESDRPVLRGLSLKVPAGQTLALIGTSGSGKSTVAQLVPRFYDVSAGAIRVGGHDVRELTLASLRGAIGLVPEDGFLFSDTIAANISFGRPGASREQVIAAAQAAQADEFIDALPGGYDTVIGERGLTLSGGQRQRLALARALMADPAVLILDDATSAVDPKVEAQLHASLRAATAGRTTLLIAHRRSTLALADQIAVIDQGQLVDCGTEAELRTRCAEFTQLVGGPGDDAEGCVERLLTPAFAGPQRQPQTPPSRQAAVAATRAVHGGMFADIPPSPELLAQVAALPPASEDPALDLDVARAPDPRFRLSRLLRPFAAGLALGLVLDGLDALAMIAMPAIMGSGVNRAVLARSLAQILTLAGAALALVMGDWLVNRWQTTVVGRNGERLLYLLRVRSFAHLQRLGLDYYDREPAGRIMTRMTTDVEALSTFLQTGLITMVNSLLTFAGVLIAMLVIDVRLGLAVAALLPPLAVATWVCQVKSSRAYRDAREKVSRVNADFAEKVAGLRITQAFRQEARTQRRFAGLSLGYRDSRMRAQKLIALYFPFAQALGTVAAAIVLVAAAGPVAAGVLSAGAVVAYLLYIDLLFAPVQQIAQVFDGYQQAVVGLNRIGELLRTPTSVPQSGRRRPGEPGKAGRLAGEIELAEAVFRYPGASRDALGPLSLTVRPGETVALVGQTGAGKSTLVKLVARYYDVTDGVVRADGVDLREYDLVSYRRRLGVVPQEPHLTAGTVADAIAYGRPGASRELVEAAARAVGADVMISGLPGGYAYVLSERGRNLSAGQRQLLALARAYLVDPDILLLDEATAALDVGTERAVLAATEKLARQRTTLVIAHRLTTAARADRIVVLDNGLVAEDGTHEELLAADGIYNELWSAFTSETAPIG